MAVGIPFGWIVVDESGNPVSGAKIYFKKGGTSTDQAAYTDDALTTPAANPTIAAANGWFRVYLDPTKNYDITVKSADDATTYYTATHHGLSDTSQPIDATLTAAAAVGFESRKIWRGTGTDTVENAFIGAIIGGVYNVLDYGATGDGTTDDRASIQSAIDAAGAAGGGIVYLPPGTYSLTDSNSGAANWDNRRCLYFNASCANVTLAGAGIDATVLKLANTQDAHVIKIGSRVTSTVTVDNIEIRDLTINGNRANQSTPNDTDDHQQGIDVSTDCTRIRIRNVKIHDTMYYGIGFQRGGHHHCLVEHVEIYNTGADGIDCKDDNDDSTGNVMRHVRVRTHGLLTGLTLGQAGIDLRSGWTAYDIDVGDMTSTKALNGIRIQNGTPGATPVQPARLYNFRVDGVDTANSVGLRIISKDVTVSDGYVTDCADGVSASNPYCRISNVTAESCVAGFRFWQDSGASVEADNNTITGLVARSNTTYGIVCDSVDDITFMGCDVTSSGTGYDIRSGCTGIRVLGGYCSGNATAQITDNGTNTTIQNVVGVKTESKAVSASIAIDSTGVKSFTITHGLAFTPALEDVQLTLQRETNVSDWESDHLWAVATSSSQISGQVEVKTASSTAIATVKVQALTRVKTGA